MHDDLNFETEICELAKFFWADHAGTSTSPTILLRDVFFSVRKKNVKAFGKFGLQFKPDDIFDTCVFHFLKNTQLSGSVAPLSWNLEVGFCRKPQNGGLFQ